MRQPRVVEGRLACRAFQLTAEPDRFLQVVNLSPEGKAGVLAMSDARKWLLIKAYIAGGGTISVSESGSSVRDAPASVASKLKVSLLRQCTARCQTVTDTRAFLCVRCRQTDPSLPVLQSLEKCVREKDGTWFDKFLLAGGAQALFDVIALKQSLEPNQKKADDIKVRGRARVLRGLWLTWRVAD